MPDFAAVAEDPDRPQFFVYGARDRDGAEVIWNATKTFTGDQGFRLTDRRIFRLDYLHEGEHMEAQVGLVHPYARPIEYEAFEEGEAEELLVTAACSVGTRSLSEPESRTRLSTSTASAPTTRLGRMAEERAQPKSPKPRPIVSNPSVPGVQKPGNKPDGRDAPPQEETRALRRLPPSA